MLASTSSLASGRSSNACASIQPEAGCTGVAAQIANEIVNTVKGLQVYEQELIKNTTERARVTEEFGADISRFKELKGIR